MQKTHSESASCCNTPESNSTTSRKAQQAVCPVSGAKGHSVSMHTIKAMLSTSLDKINPNASYLFCQTEECPVVYFSDDGRSTFVEAEIRERVHQKNSSDDSVLVCYCFQHSPNSIRQEWLQTGKSSVIDRVTAATRTKLCACDIRNPQGSCCLGNIRKVVKNIVASK